MFEHWGHFYTIFELTGRDYNKMDYWREQSIVYIYNCLAFRKDLQDEEAKKNNNRMI
jgi:hypothetical protein|tara:strand:+ start:395 stop:565 length:171 start_codon:yes stop_codon:yes gene_type:complete